MIYIFNFCDTKAACVAAYKPRPSVPAVVSITANDGCLSFQLSMRSEQARVLGLQLRGLADQADELQQAYDLALLHQEEKAAS